MKMSMIIIFIFLFSSIKVDAQQQDSLIQLYHGMGDTLDYMDREMIGLYLEIEGFKYAQLFNRNKKFLVSKINYVNIDGIENVFTKIEDYIKLAEIRNQIYQVQKENIDKKPISATIRMITGNSCMGKLKMFSKRHLYLDVNEYPENEGTNNSKYKIPIKRIDFITIKQEKGFEKNLPYIGYSMLGGGALGFVIGLSNDDYWDMLSPFERGGITGLIGLGIGAFVGIIIGEIVEEPFIDMTITFNSANDILKLKEYSAYYFQQDKSVEEKYVEIK